MNSLVCNVKISVRRIVPVIKTDYCFIWPTVPFIVEGNVSGWASDLIFLEAYCIRVTFYSRINPDKVVFFRTHFSLLIYSWCRQAGEDKCLDISSQSDLCMFTTESNSSEGSEKRKIGWCNFLHSVRLQCAVVGVDKVKFYI